MEIPGVGDQDTVEAAAVAEPAVDWGYTVFPISGQSRLRMGQYLPDSGGMNIHLHHLPAILV